MNIPSIMISLFVLNLLDLWSTIMCVSNGFKESNPYMEYLLDAGLFIEYKLLFGFGLLLFSLYYYKQDSKNYTFMKYSLIAVCTIYSSTIWSNFNLIL